MPNTDLPKIETPSNVVPLGKPGVRCLELRLVEKGALIGFCNLHIEAWNLTLIDCKWFRKGPAEWIGLPSTSYTNKLGTKVYTELIEFTDKEVAERFKAAALTAIHSFKP